MNHPELYEEQKNAAMQASKYDQYMDHLKLYKNSQERDRYTRPKMMTIKDTEKLID